MCRALCEQHAFRCLMCTLETFSKRDRHQGLESVDEQFRGNYEHAHF